MTSAANGSVASVRLGGRDYAVKSVPSCKTCKSPLRRVVEEALVRGDPPGAIAAAVPEAGVTAANIASHFKNGHLPLVEAALDFAGEDARERGEAVEHGAFALAGELAFARTVLGRAMERVSSGAEQPTIRDGLAAEALLAKYGAGAHEFDEQEWVGQTMTMMNVLHEMLGAEAFEEFAERVSAHPAFQRSAGMFPPAGGGGFRPPA